VVINKSEQALILALIPMGFENVRKHTLATSYFPLFCWTCHTKWIKNLRVDL